MPISPSAKRWLLGAVGGLWFGACGDETAEPEPLPARDSSVAMPRDGGSDPDASSFDDAGVDAGQPAPDAGLVSECRGDLLSFPAARASGRIFSAGVAGNHAQLVYLEPACGGTRARSNAQALMHTHFETTGDASEPVGLVNAAPADCYATRDPAVLSSAPGSLELFFTSNRAGRNELYYLGAAEDAEPSRQTDNTWSERATASAHWGATRSVRVAYAKEQAGVGAVPVSEIVTAGVGGPEIAVAPADEGFHATQLALIALEYAEEGIGGALAWLSDSPARAGLFLRFVDDVGAPVGELLTLSDRPGATSNVALAARSDGGAVVYTTDPSGSIQELRFRRLEADGTLGKEVELTRINERVRDVSIAAYASGYVVAYRSEGRLDGSFVGVRVMFVDHQGNVGRKRLVAPASPDGVGAQVLVARDGRLLVFWGDLESVPNPTSGRSELENSVRVARVVCP